MSWLESHQRRRQQRREQEQLAGERARVGPNGWTCHICHHYRPDALIGVRSTPRILAGGVVMTENVRYCLDNPDCVEAAKTFSFTKADDAAL